MRSLKSASWRPEWTSLTLTGAFKPLYSCCRLHYRWPWRQRHNKTSPIWSPEGDSSTAATASTHSLWLGAPSSGEERVGCGKCWPACVKLCASAVGDSEDSRVTTFQQSALPGCAAKTHPIGVFPPVCRLHGPKLSIKFQVRCRMNKGHFWFTVFSLFFLYFKYNYTLSQIIYTGIFEAQIWQGLVSSHDFDASVSLRFGIIVGSITIYSISVMKWFIWADLKLFYTIAHCSFSHVFIWFY